MTPAPRGGRHDDIDELLAQQRIRDTLMRYCRGVDRCDVDLVRSAYHPDSTDDHGYWKGNGWDFAEFIVAAKLADNDWTTHSVSNVLAEVEGGTALVESYVRASLKPRDLDELRVFVGRNVDRFTCVDGAWRIAHRVVVYDWDDVTALTPGGIGLPLEGFIRGQRGGQRDLVFTLSDTSGGDATVRREATSMSAEQTTNPAAVADHAPG